MLISGPVVPMSTALTSYPFDAAVRTILGRETSRIGALETEVLSLFEVPTDGGAHDPAGCALVPGVVPVAEVLGDRVGVVEGLRQLVRVLPAPGGLAGAVAADHNGQLRNRWLVASAVWVRGRTTGIGDLASPRVKVLDHAARRLGNHDPAVFLRGVRMLSPA